MFFLKDKNKENTTINAIVRHKGKRFKISTGEKVSKEYWNAAKSRCKEGRQYPDGASINLRLDIWENHIKTVLNNFAMKFQVPSDEEFKEAFKQTTTVEKTDEVTNDFTTINFVDFAKKYREISNKSFGTKKVYQTSINWFESYEKHLGRKLQFSDINNHFYKDFYSFVFKSGKVNSPNFFGTLIKNIKVFMNVAKEEGIHEINSHNSSSFKKIDLDVDNVYLTIDELVKIHRLEINEAFVKSHFDEIKINNVRQKVKALELVRGRFLIGAFTALRVSDFTRIEDLNIKDNLIRIRTEKNDHPVVIPVHWVVREILDSGFNLSERISDQKINKQIKVLCRYAGFTDLVVLTKFDSGKRIDIVKPKCEWVTTHTARRSGATNMFKAGIPSISIMKITGHHTEKAFLKYIKVTQEENALILAEHPFFRKAI
jgi:integrase